MANHCKVALFATGARVFPFCNSTHFPIMSYCTWPQQRHFSWLACFVLCCENADNLYFDCGLPSEDCVHTCKVLTFQTALIVSFSIFAACWSAVSIVLAISCKIYNLRSFSRKSLLRKVEIHFSMTWSWNEIIFMIAKIGKSQPTASVCLQTSPLTHPALVLLAEKYASHMERFSLAWNNCSALTTLLHNLYHHLCLTLSQIYLAHPNHQGEVAARISEHHL